LLLGHPVGATTPEVEKLLNFSVYCWMQTVERIKQATVWLWLRY